MFKTPFSVNECCRFRMKLVGDFILLTEQNETIATINVTNVTPEFESKGYSEEALCDYITLAFNYAVTKGLYVCDMEEELLKLKSKS